MAIRKGKKKTGRLEMEDRLLGMVERASSKGESLPGEPTLANMLGVSRPSLREALVRLERDGVIHRRKGSQTFINKDALDLAGRFDQVGDFSEVLSEAGFVPSVEVLVEERIKMGSETANAFGCEVGTPVLRIVKRWLADGSPVRLAIDEVPLPSFDVKLPKGRSVLELVPHLTGQKVLWDLAVPGAVNATKELSEWLDVPLRSALLVLECIGISQAGERVFYAHDYYVPGAVRLGLIRTIDKLH
jgi:GntR family transcriptional regulator